MVFGSTHPHKKTEEKQIIKIAGRFIFFKPPAFFKAGFAKKHMKEFFTTKRLCRAGVIAALYVALTYAFGAIAYNGILQIRPAEALTILPLFFPEAVPALWVGCMLANLGSPFIMYDVPLGGLATLIAALLTYGAGRLIKNNVLKVAVGGFFPIIVNSFIIPIIIVFLCGGAEGYKSAAIAYWTYFGSMCATESLWIYGLGIPLFVTIYHLRKKGVFVFVDGKEAPPEPQKESVKDESSSASE